MRKPANNRAVRAAPSTPHTHTSKQPHAQAMHLQIEAAHCPEFLARALGLVARTPFAPVTLAFSRDEDALRLEMQLDGSDQAVAETLLHRVRNLVAVRSADLRLGPTDPPI